MTLGNYRRHLEQVFVAGDAEEGLGAFLIATDQAMQPNKLTLSACCKEHTKLKYHRLSCRPPFQSESSAGLMNLCCSQLTSCTERTCTFDHTWRLCTSFRRMMVVICQQLGFDAMPGLIRAELPTACLVVSGPNFVASKSLLSCS